MHSQPLLFFIHALVALLVSRSFFEIWAHAQMHGSDSADPVKWGMMLQLSSTERVSAVIGVLAQYPLLHRHNNVMLLFLCMIHFRSLT